MDENIQPIFILPEGYQRTSGRNALKNNIAAAIEVADTVRTTLGPKGMDKMLVDSSGEIIVTNDGVTILREMEIEHPAAKMIVEVAKTQEDEIGDGTTTAVIIAGELLRNAEELINQNIHPSIIIRGYRTASNFILKKLDELKIKVDVNNEETLLNIAKTAMTGKGADVAKEHLGKIIIDAVKTTTENNYSDKDNIKIIKKQGNSIYDSELIKGIVIDKERVHPEMPKKVENAKILLLDLPIELRDTEIDAKIQITDPEKIQEFLDTEERIIKNIVNKIVKTGANTIFCQKGIDEIAQFYLAQNNIFAVRRVKRSDMEKISKATGAKIMNSLDNIPEKNLGHAGKVYEKKVGDENLIFIEECNNPKAVTILLRGASEHVVDELERAIDDAICGVSSAINQKQIVPGAGAIETQLSVELKEYSTKLSGKEQVAVEFFSKAIEVIPRTLAENSGLDPLDVLTELKLQHQKGNKTYGIDVQTGKIIDVIKLGIIEPLKIKQQAISSATEVTTMILRVDDVISARSNKKESRENQNKRDYERNYNSEFE